MSKNLTYLLTNDASIPSLTVEVSDEAAEDARNAWVGGEETSITVVGLQGQEVSIDTAVVMGVVINELPPTPVGQQQSGMTQQQSAPRHKASPLVH